MGRGSLQAAVLPLATVGVRVVSWQGFPPSIFPLPSDAIVRGIVWLDADANGVRAAGEVGYSGGVTVELRQGSIVIATTTTDPSGHYVFNSVLPGNYSVRFVTPTGFAFSPSNQGTDDSTDSDADPSTGSSGTFTLTSGQDLAGPDAGIFTSVASWAPFCRPVAQRLQGTVAFL